MLSDERTNERTDGQTFVIVESLSRLKTIVHWYNTLVAVLALLEGDVELGPEAELSLSLASLFLDSVFAIFFTFFSLTGSVVIRASNSSSDLSSDPASAAWELGSLLYSLKVYIFPTITNITYFSNSPPSVPQLGKSVCFA